MHSIECEINIGTLQGTKVNPDIAHFFLLSLYTIIIIDVIIVITINSPATCIALEKRNNKKYKKENPSET